MSLTTEQLAVYRSLRKNWKLRWFYTARRAYLIARDTKAFAVSRRGFW